MNAEFNPASKRARQARFLVLFSKTLRNSIFLIALILAIIGTVLWTQGSFAGSFLISIAIIFLMPLIWFKYDISKMSRLPLTAQKITVEDNLAPIIVGRLKTIDNPHSIWEAAKGTWQQRFFSLHYGIEPQIFNNLSQEKTDLNKMWQYACELSQKHGETGISTAALIVSLIRTMPEYEQVLADRGLDIDELESSIDWVHHAESVNELSSQKNNHGGIARDWTSGFTPTLNQMAHNISLELERSGFMIRDLEGHKATIDEIISSLKDGRQNALLVGDVGVGKTITVYGVASRLMQDSNLPESIKYHQVFAINPTSLITSSDDPNKVESIFTRIIIEAQKSKNTILFLDDASTFFAQGTGQVDIGKILQSILENNALPLILAMTPSEWQKISSTNQALVGTLNVIKVAEADKEHSLRVLEDQSLYLEARTGALITYQALETAIDLSERYIRDIAAPGRAIKLLENSINHAESGFVTAKSVQLSIEATQGVKVQTADSGEKIELLNLEEEIHKRMINQNRAVKVVSDALRRARSGVNNPDKPIGTFLFLGPTGVGKTELSKSVAAVYFGDEQKIIRVDMNEFTQSADTSRMLDSKSENSLLASIGRNPFSVVLFDELEKAHSDVVNTILQMLDEGIMRDNDNRQFSFKDAIVIATSNAGAESIRGYIDKGLEVEQFETQFTDSLIDSGIFRPEFINRFDEIVVFRPLKQSELLQVVDLLLIGVNSNLAKQKISVELTDEAKQWLTSQGYDERLGARPLRRMVQRTVENIIAKKVLNSEVNPGSVITLNKADLESESK